jgi:hypothetical protein
VDGVAALLPYTRDVLRKRLRERVPDERDGGGRKMMQDEG